MNSISSSRSVAIIGLVLTSLFWSGNIFISKILIDIVPPFTLNMIRWLIAILVLSPFALPSLVRLWPIIKRSWLQLSVYGFLGVTVYNAFLYNAAYTTDGLNIAVISTVTPLFTFIFAWMFFGDKPSVHQMVGFVFGICGVLLLISQGSLSVFQQLAFNNGDIWMLSASLAWAVYTAYLVKKPQGLPSIVFMFATTVLGILMALPSVVWEFSQGHIIAQFNQTVILSLVYIGIFPSVCSYLFFNHGVSVLGSQTASLCAYLIPVFTAIIGILFLQESIHWYHVVSQILVFVGFYLALMKSKSR